MAENIKNHLREKIALQSITDLRQNGMSDSKIKEMIMEKFSLLDNETADRLFAMKN